jgi:glyoxylase I family protein
MKFHHVEITVGDMERSLGFYTEVLDFEVEDRFELEEMGADAAMLKLGEMHLELFDFEEGKENSDPLDRLKVKGIRHIALEVENLEDKMDELREEGLEFSEIEKTTTGKYFYTFTEDPDGIPIEFYAETN